MDLRRATFYPQMIPKAGRERGRERGDLCTATFYPEVVPKARREGGRERVDAQQFFIPRLFQRQGGREGGREGGGPKEAF